MWVLRLFSKTDRAGVRGTDEHDINSNSQCDLIWQIGFFRGVL